MLRNLEPHSARRESLGMCKHLDGRGCQTPRLIQGSPWAPLVLLIGFMKPKIKNIYQILKIYV